MESNDRSIHIEFESSGKKTDVSLTALTNTVIEFLDIYGTISLAGKQFCSIIGEGEGSEKFLNLLKESGYSNDPEAFFTQLLSAITDGEVKKVIINQVSMPHLMLMAILEQVLIGHIL